MSMMPPLNADARSSVEIEDSCNCCVGLRRRPRHDHRRPTREPSVIEVTPTALKVKSASQPVLTQTAVDEWEIMIDGRKISSEPALSASSMNIPTPGQSK